MLDECKGEKFEEVLATFAGIVLKRVCETYAASGSLQHHETGTILPLIVAHRNHIRCTIDQRRQLRKHALQSSSALKRDRIDINLQRQALQQKKFSISELHTGVVKGLVRSCWIDGTCTAEALLDGTFNSSFQTSGAVVVSTRARDSTLMIDERVQMYNKRLENWKTCLTALTAPIQSKTGATIVHEPVSSTVTPKRFHRHQRFVPQGQLELAWNKSIMHEKPRALLDALKKELSTEIGEIRSRSSGMLHQMTQADWTIRSTTQVDDHTADKDTSSTYTLDHGSTMKPAPLPSIDMRSTHSSGSDDSELSPVATTTTQWYDLLDEGPTSQAHLRLSPPELTRDTPQTTLDVPTPAASASVSRSSARARLEGKSSLIERTRRSLTRTRVEEKRSARIAMKLRHKESSSHNVAIDEQADLETSVTVRDGAGIKADAPDFGPNVDDPFKSRPKLAASPVLDPLERGIYDFEQNNMPDAILLPRST